MRQEGMTPKATDSGTTPKEISDLVEAVHCHARALVLLAQEVSRRGVCATTETLQQIMEDLHQKYPDDREDSLYASIELSLRRLLTETRDKIRVLAVFHGGASMGVLAQMLNLEPEPVFKLGAELIDVGLAEEKGYGYLGLDPALPTYLRREMDSTEQTQFTEQWATAMMQLVSFLYQQLSKDAQLAAQLTLLELPNLMALLAWILDKATPEQVVGLAGRIEQLLEYLNRPQALAQAVAVREQAQQSLTGWSHAQFQSEQLQIERLLDKRDLPAAYTAVQQLLQRCVEAGEKAYPGADYDIAYIHWLFGRVLSMGGQAEAALQRLNKAQQRFQQLADAGNQSAERMASAAIMDMGDCMRNLGQLEDAATAYQAAIQRAEKRQAARDIAVGKGQLGSVHLLQQRYTDALKRYTEAKDIVEALGESGSVAGVWHQIGMLHRKTEQFELADQAYRQSLAIQVQRKNKAGEASSLTELGNLYLAMERLEEAVVFYRQAADIDVELKDLKNEGLDRNNLANTLIKLHRYDEARDELHRAIDCKNPFSHAAKPWKTWAILYNLEQATNHPQAAAEARQQAIDSFMAYRRAGGENHSGAGKLCAFVAQAMRDGKTEEVQEALAELAEIPEWQLVVSKLQAILNGERNPKLADDPDLYYRDVVELRLLLESLPEEKGVVDKIRGWLGV
jgi:tetratricopeptide (TPR) repeat protein